MSGRLRSGCRALRTTFDHCFSRQVGGSAEPLPLLSPCRAVEPCGAEPVATGLSGAHWQARSKARPASGQQAAGQKTTSGQKFERRGLESRGGRYQKVASMPVSESESFPPTLVECDSPSRSPSRSGARPGSKSGLGPGSQPASRSRPSPWKQAPPSSSHPGTHPGPPAGPGRGPPAAAVAGAGSSTRTCPPSGRAGPGRAGSWPPPRPCRLDTPADV